MDTAKAPAADTTAPVAKPVLNLGPGKDLAQSCAVSFEPKAPPCSQTFETVIYATEEQEFWFLSKTAAASMTEAIYTLEKQIAPSKSHEERIKGLDDSGLLEYFLEPKLSNFLEGEDRTRMDAIEAQEPDIALAPSMVLRSKREKELAEAKANPAPAAAPTDVLTQRLNQLKQANDDLSTVRDKLVDMGKLHAEWLLLKKKAVAKAKTQGYTYENGSLFTPAAMEARKRVQTYLELRKPLLTDKGAKVYSTDEIARLLAENKKRYEDLRNCMSTCNAAMSTYGAWRAEQAGKFKYADYTDAIIRVAEYGIAVPEYALMTADISSGIEQFNAYLAAEKAQLDVNKRLSEKYKSWIDASGQNAKAPAGLVAAERVEWDRLQTVKEGLKEKARQNVDAASIRRHLLWDPEQFQPQPVDRLVKAGFPLREVSTLGAKKKPLSWLSVLNLRDAEKIIKQDLTKAGKKVPEAFKTLPGNGDGGASKDSALSVFGQWLTAHGALRIDDQAGEWFSHEGWFDIDKFYLFLKTKGITVTQLQNSADRQEWGERLKQMVFKQSVRGSLRLFDKSPQAQFVRCLTPPQENIHHEFKGEGPSFSATKGFEMSGSAALSFDLARGEVELVKVDLPDRAKATDLTVKYYIDDQNTPQSMNLGRFSMHFGVRAWGYAGASLMLAGSVEVTPGNTKYGATLSPIKPAQREDAAAKEERAAYDAEQERKKAAGDQTPSAPLVHESKAATAISNNTSETKLKGEAANVQIDQGVKASFNLFAGVQAGIELTGAMNWAPPRELAALRSAPTGGISTAAQAKSDSQWLTLAKLSGSLGAAFGAGMKADAQLSLDRGKFILNLKASIVLGPGATGSFKMEVGYEAVVEIINLFRRELHKSEGQRLTWITDDAADQASKLNLLGAAGLDVAMVYMMGIDVIMSLYEALTSGGRGGPIAHTIMTYSNPTELKDWFVNATPSALGPLLMTLTARPTAFNITSTNINGSSQKNTYKYDEAYVLQQQAIERVLGWITSNGDASGTFGNAQSQFENACMRMNKFGSPSENKGQAYCESRQRIDDFMSLAIMIHTNQAGVYARARYKDWVARLGANLDSYCKINYNTNSYFPRTTYTYTGPK